MTLGELIEVLEKMDPNSILKKGLSNSHSYRGSYDELAFEPKENVCVADLLKEARCAVGKTYTGYKGVNYKMHEYTDVNIAKYGETGEKLTLSFFENTNLVARVVALEAESKNQRELLEYLVYMTTRIKDFLRSKP